MGHCFRKFIRVNLILQTYTYFNSLIIRLYHKATNEDLTYIIMNQMSRGLYMLICLCTYIPTYKHLYVGTNEINIPAKDETNYAHEKNIHLTR